MRETTPNEIGITSTIKRIVNQIPPDPEEIIEKECHTRTNSDVITLLSIIIIMTLLWFVMLS